MHIKPFLLDRWLDEHKGVRHNLACSTGPVWTLKRIIELMTPEEKEHLWDENVTYSVASGDDDLRQAIAEMEGVTPEEIQIVNLASLAELDETEIGLEQLKARRLIGSTNKRVKVLGQGSLDRAITVRAHAFSASAVQKIEAVGGRAELIG